jgi:hypothetical protein
MWGCMRKGVATMEGADREQVYPVRGGVQAVWSGKPRPDAEGGWWWPLAVRRPQVWDGVEDGLRSSG